MNEIKNKERREFLAKAAVAGVAIGAGTNLFGAANKPNIACKVPAAQVGGQLPHEAHRFRVAVVRIVLLRAEGGDLHGAGVDADGDRAMLQPGGQSAGKNLHHLLRQGTGADIPIVGPDAQRHIPDAAAHQIGHMTPGLETAQNLAHIFRGRDIVHKRTSPKKHQSGRQRRHRIICLQCGSGRLGCGMAEK